MHQSPLRRIVLRTLILIAAAFQLVTTLRAASFQGLGDLPGGGVQGYAIGVSADGHTVVGHSISASGDESFVWTASSGMIGLGDLTGGSFSSFSTMAANGASVVVGYGTAANGYRPFRTVGGGPMTILGDLPGGSDDGFATGMSADGNMICGQGSSASGTEAFRYTDVDGMIGLGDLPGGVFDSSAWVVSTDGTAIAGDGTTAAGRQAVVWTAAAGLVPLGFLPGGGSFSGAHGVSNGGTFVAGASDSSHTTSGNAEAWRWSAGGMVGLGDLPGGAYNSFANGMSSDGRVVVGGSDTAIGTEAFFWTSECGMRNLKDYLSSLDVTSVSSWTLQNAHGVSADGMTIVGYGINGAGQTEPWIARIEPCEAGAGAVPDGAGVAGAPLTVERVGRTVIILSWGASCRPGDVDYEVYEGAIPSFTSHAPRLCSTAGATTVSLSVATGNWYYLVAASNGAFEGSYGTRSNGMERPVSAAACAPQILDACP